MPYPSTVGTFTNPNPTQRLNNPSQSSVVTALNTAVTEIETFVGTLSSAVGTLVYDIRATASGGGGHVQSANKGGTGQTSYAKGDLLVASSSSVLSKLTVGQNNLVLTADSTESSGMKWTSVASGSATNVSTIIPTWVGNPAVSPINKDMNNSVLGYVALLNIPTPISVNKVSWEASSSSTAGVYRFALFNESGQSSVLFVNASVTTGTNVKSFNVSSVQLAAGNYWQVVVPVTPVNMGFWTYKADLASSPNKLYASVAGKVLTSGRITVVSDTMPSSITTANIASGEANPSNAIIMRLDN